MKPVWTRINPIDAAVALLALGVVVLAAVGYALFRTPARPRIDRVEPMALVSGHDLRVQVTGENFLPFFRVFLERTGGPPTLSQRLESTELSDEFTMSSRVQARFVVESPRLAEVWVPDGTLPGTYALSLYDETRRVEVRDSAFTIQPAALGEAPRGATIRAFGAFTGLRADAVQKIAPGTRFASPSGPIAEVLSVLPAVPDGMRLQVGNTFVRGAVAGRMQVPATVRLFCVPFDGRCRAGTTYAAVLTELPLPFEGETARFFIHEITPDVPAEAAQATVVVRFEAAREIAGLVKAGDSEQLAVGLASAGVPAAALVGVGPRRELPDRRTVVFDGEMRLPIVQSESALLFRGEPLKVGQMLSLTTGHYIIRGAVVAIRPQAAQAPASR